MKLYQLSYAKSEILKFISGFFIEVQHLLWSRLFRDVGWVLILRGVIQLLTFFASAYAMRQLGPYELGIGSFVISTVAQASLFGSFGLNITSIRAMIDRPEDKSEIVSTVSAFRLLIAIILSFILIFIIRVFNLPGSPLSWGMAVPLILISVLAPHWIFQGLERVPILNIIELIQTVIVAGLYFILFRSGAKAELYIGVTLLTQIIGWMLSYYFLSRQLTISWFSWDWNASKRMVYDSRYAFAIVLTTFVYTNLDILYATLLISPKDAGVYRAAQAPMGILAPILTMIPLVIYPRLVAWKKKPVVSYLKNFRTLLIILFIFSTIVFIVSIILIPIVFKYFLGAEFLEGVLPAKLLILAKCVGLLGSISLWSVIAFGQEKYQLRINFFAAGISLFLNLLLVPIFGLLALSSIYIVSEGVIFIVSTMYLLIHLKHISDQQ